MKNGLVARGLKDGNIFDMKRIVLPVLLLAATLLAQNPDVVSIDQEPSHHVVLDNEYVRVFDVTVAPHEATRMHRHEADYMFLTLGDSTVSNERMNEKPARLELKDGQVRYVKGGFAHIARNLADTPFHNITIELKSPGAPVCGVDPAHACESADMTGIVQELFSTAQAVARMTILDPGQQTPAHTHATPHLAIAVDDLTFENHPEGKPATAISMKKGEVVWVSESGITHYFKNTGKDRARVLSLDLRR